MAKRSRRVAPLQRMAQPSHLAPPPPPRANDWDMIFTLPAARLLALLERFLLPALKGVLNSIPVPPDSTKLPGLESGMVGLSGISIKALRPEDAHTFHLDLNVAASRLELAAPIGVGVNLSQADLNAVLNNPGGVPLKVSIA